MTTHLRLEPEPAAARLARRAIAEAVPADRDDERETAMLLVSELVTNAVVHAASPVDLAVDVHEDTVVVSVTDADTGPIVVPTSLTMGLGEGGRGFVLVDRLADAWGTEHHGGRKTVWFRVRSPGVAPEPARPRAAEWAADPGTPIAPATLRRLLLPRAVIATLTFEEHVRELLHRAMDAAGVDGLSAELSESGTGGGTISAGRLSSPAAGCELVVGDRSYGDLRIWSERPVDEDVIAFCTLCADRIALLAAEQGLVHSQHARSADMEFVAEATELLTRPMGVDLALALVAQIVVPKLADWCAAYRVADEQIDRLTLTHRLENKVDVTTQLLDTDVEIGNAIAEAVTSVAPHRLPAAVVLGGQRSHVTVLPLQSRGRALAVLVLGRSQPLDAVEYVSALELARRASLAVDNARLREEQAATVSALQNSLLPLALPQMRDIAFGARYHSASPDILVGGDFYDAFSLPGAGFAVAIGDVCGKGAEAAAVTGMTRDLLRLLVEDGATPAKALRRLNRALIQHPSASRFCTVALAVAAHTADGLQLTLCLAGHPEPALRRRDGTVEFVGQPGGLLGVLDDDVLELSERTVTLEPGELLVFYTDGVTERRAGGRMFGQYGIERALLDVREESADAVAATIEEAARSFTTAELRDDLAILVVQHRPV